MTMQSMGATYQLPLHRRKTGKTDYRKRYGLLLSGKDRLVIRHTNNRSIVQCVSYNKTGDVTSLYTDSFTLQQYGWTNYTGNIPAAYLTGYLFGKRLQHNSKEAALVPDIGVFKPEKQGRVFAVMKGVSDSGISLQVKASLFPAEERIRGEHIANYAEQATGQQFQQRKEKAHNITQEFDQVKQQIEQTFGE